MSTAVFSVKVSSLVASWKEHSGNSRKTTNKSKTLIRQLPQSGSESWSSACPHGHSCQASGFSAWAHWEEEHGGILGIILKSPGISESLQQTCSAFYDGFCLISSLRVRLSLQTFSIPVAVVCVRTLKGAKLRSFPGRGMQAVSEQGEQHKQSF